MIAQNYKVMLQSLWWCEVGKEYKNGIFLICDVSIFDKTFQRRKWR